MCFEGSRDVAQCFSKVLGKEVQWKELPAEDFEAKLLSPKQVQLYAYIQGAGKEEDLGSLIGPGSSFEHFLRENKLQLEKD